MGKANTSVELRTQIDPDLSRGVDALVLVSGTSKAAIVSQALRLYFYELGLGLPSSIHPAKASKTHGRLASTRKGTKS